MPCCWPSSSINHKIHKGPDQETDEDDGAGEGKLQVPFVKD